MVHGGCRGCRGLQAAHLLLMEELGEDGRSVNDDALDDLALEVVGDQRGERAAEVEEGLAREPEHLARADRDDVGLAHGVVRVVLEARLTEDGALDDTEARVVLLRGGGELALFDEEERVGLGTLLRDGGRGVRGE